MRLLACIAALVMLFGPLGSWARSQCETRDPSSAMSCCSTPETPSCCNEPDAGGCDDGPAPTRDGSPCDPGSGCWWLCVALCNAVIEPAPMPQDSGANVAVALLPAEVWVPASAPLLSVRAVSGAPPDPTIVRLSRLCRWLT
ncbi:MAG: hypothetical protein JNM80_01560 [Phycisphaerae bacterium]|nr:hypothetical protein [Phycisphaerae bacterium]